MNVDYRRIIFMALLLKYLCLKSELIFIINTFILLCN